jgi:dihydrofolate reductase
VAAGNKDIAIAGGASAVQQYLAAAMLDERYLHIVPIVLWAGERLLENVGAPTLEPVKVIDSSRLFRPDDPKRAYDRSQNLVARQPRPGLGSGRHDRRQCRLAVSQRN